MPDRRVPNVDRDWQAVLSGVGLIVLFAILDRWLIGISRMPAARYESASISAEFAAHLASLRWKAAPLLPILLLMIARRRGVATRWGDLEQGSVMRLIVGTSACLLAWMYATYNYNAYFAESHAWDRWLIVLFAAGTVWRPFLVWPLLAVLLPVIAQFAVPLGVFTWSIPYLPLRVLILFAAMLLWGLATQRWKTSPFAFGLCCLFAAHYWPSAMGKLRLGWLADDHVQFILPNTYANGWLAFLDAEAISSLTGWLAAANWPIKLVTLALECGALLVLWRRSLLMALLSGWILLHLGIFLVTGICFWPWAVLDGVLLWVVWKRPTFVEELFRAPLFAVSVVTIATAPFWMKPVKLAWLDARATYTYRFEAIDASGRRHSLPPRFFEPYVYEFTVSGFAYLSQAPILHVTWGATSDRELARRLFQAQTAEDVLRIESQFGKSRRDPNRAADLVNFLRRFVANYNRHEDRASWLEYLRSPPALWTFGPAGNSLPDQIVRIEVDEVLTFLNGRGEYEEIRRRPVLQVQIPSM